MDAITGGIRRGSPAASDTEAAQPYAAGEDPRARAPKSDAQQTRVKADRERSPDRRVSGRDGRAGANNLIIRTPPKPSPPAAAPVPASPPAPVQAPAPALPASSKPTSPAESIQALTDRLTAAFPTIRGVAETKLKQIFKEKFNVAIEPKNVRILSFNYRKGESETSRGAIYASKPLIDAAIENVQAFPSRGGVAVPWRERAPRIALQKSVTLTPLGAHYPKIDAQGESRVVANAYTGVYETRGEPSPGQVLEPGTQLPVSPTALSDAFWKADLSSAYQSSVNAFWEKNRSAYTTVAKANFLEAADRQLADGTLPRQAHDLAWRMAHGGPRKASSALTPGELMRPPTPDPAIEMGLVNIAGHGSTDLIYGTKKKSGLTVLYVPGSPSPFHTFKDMAGMKRWLADEMASPLKRENLGRHFAARDRWDRILGVGVDAALRDVHEGKGGSPDDVITGTPSPDPFRTATRRLEQRTKDDGKALISTQRDYYKARLRTTVNAGKALGTGASFIYPPAGAVVGGLAGLGEMSLGVDDHIHGKQGQAGVVSGLQTLITSAASVSRADPRGPAAASRDDAPPAPSSTAELTSAPYIPGKEGTSHRRSQLPTEVVNTLKTMDDTRHFVGIMNTRTRVIYIFPSALKGNPGSGSEIRAPLPDGFTYQAGPGVQRTPHPSGDLIELQRKNFGLTGHAALVDLVNGESADFVGFSGIKEPGDTFRLDWSSPTLNPRYATARAGSSQPGADVLGGKLRQAVVVRFERAGFKVAP